MGNTPSHPSENGAFKFTSDLRRKIYMKKKAHREFGQFLRARKNVTKQYNDIVKAVYTHEN